MRPTPEELITLIQPLVGKKKAERLLYSYTATSDARQKQFYADRIRLLTYKILGADFETKILLAPPAKEDVAGEVRLGNVVYNGMEICPFGISKRELGMHLAVYGRTGSGKTNVGFALLNGLMGQHVPFMVFDWKRNYRPLLDKGEVLLFTPGDSLSPFFFNPLIPPAGVNPKIWREHLVAVLGFAFFVGEGAMTILDKAIDAAYREFGVYDGNAQSYPTFRDVEKFFWKAGRQQGREMLWAQSAGRTLRALTNSTLADSINVQRYPPLASLLEENVILELDALSPSNKVFFIQALLLWLYFYRLNKPRGEGLRQVVVVEEAQNILLKTRDGVASANILPKVIRESRELGVGLVFIAQEPSKMDTTAMQNVYTLIALNQRYRKDIEILGGSMNLKFQEWDNLGRVPLGEGIVNMKGNFPGSFLVKLPFVKLEEHITDEAVRETMKSYSGRKGMEYPQVELGRKEMAVPEIASLPPSMRSMECPPKNGFRKRDQNEPEPSSDDALFLLEVFDHPSATVTEHYKKLGLGPRDGTRRKAFLLGKGFVAEEDVVNGLGRRKLLRLTMKGEALLRGRLLIGDEVKHGNGAEHRYWKKKVREDYEARGYRVDEEVGIGKEGKRIDLVAKKGDERIAVEIETGTNSLDQIVANFKKCMDAGFLKVLVVGTTRATRERVGVALKKSGLAGDPRIAAP